MLRGFQRKRLFAALLCILMIMSAMIVMSHTAFADDADEKETIDYILILDCTVRAVDADAEGVRKAAAKMFVDLIPVDNARVAVFKIGDRDVDAQYGRADSAKSYKVRKDDGHMTNELYRMQCIYQLWDFDQPISTINQREELKSIIDNAYIQQQGGFSDTHCAAYAAMDTLKYWDSKNACILLVSEEFTASYNEHLVLDSNGRQVNSEHTMWDDVRTTLNANRNWIFNWVDLGNGTPSIRTIIDGLCRMNGGEACYDFSISRLPEMIATIVSKYTDSSADGKPIQLDSSGKATIELPDFVMLTEANVVVTGDGVEKVTVVDGRGSVIERPKDDIWFSTNYDPTDRSQFLYTAVKMIRPTSGAWTVNVSGKAGTQVYVQTIHTLEPDIKLSCNVKPGEMIGVGTSLQFVATYQYGGEDLHCGNDAYNHYLDGAKLYYTHSSNPDKKQDISNTLRVEDEQYVSDFVVNNRGTYTFYFYVESYDFKSGIRNAKPIENITVENHAPDIIGRIEDVTDVPVGAHLEGIFSVEKCFRDIDNESLTYVVDCWKEGRKINLEYSIAATDGYVSIEAPIVDGVYEVSVFAEDMSGARSEANSFKISVINQPPQITQNIAVKKQVLKARLIAGASEAMGGLLPKNECKAFTVNVNDLFTDPEGLPLTYQIEEMDITNEDGAEIVSIDFDHNSGLLTVSANKKGEASIVICAIDSANASEQLKLEVKVRTIAAAFFGRYWWVFALIALAIAVFLVLWKSRRVKMSWAVSIKRGSRLYDDAISTLASRGKRFRKTSVDLLAILDEVFERNEADNFLVDLTEGVIVFRGTLFGNTVPYVYNRNRGEEMAVKLENDRIEEGVDLPTKGVLHSGDRIVLNVSGAEITIEVH